MFWTNYPILLLCTIQTLRQVFQRGDGVALKSAYRLYSLPSRHPSTTASGSPIHLYLLIFVTSF